MRRNNLARNIILTVILLTLIGYLCIYLFLNSLSVEGGAKGYPTPKNRVNILVMGVAGNLSDTLMLCSYDITDKEVDIISIPRDTYYPRKGYNYLDQRKINAAYGSGGAEAAVKSVEGLTSIPINYYIVIDYKGVEDIVDALGGIKVEVSQDMDYDDPADNLHVHFSKGQIIKRGEDIVKLLRWRKNNNGSGYAEGDLGRIKMQQKIVRLGIEKLVKGNLVLNFIRLREPITKNVKTNMTPKQMIYYAVKARHIKMENLSINTIPGSSKNIGGLSFYVVNKIKLNEMLKKFDN